MTRIDVSHAGSLPRTPELIAANAARRAAAMDELRVIAGLPPAAHDLAYLGVSA